MDTEPGAPGDDDNLAIAPASAAPAAAEAAQSARRSSGPDDTRMREAPTRRRGRRGAKQGGAKQNSRQQGQLYTVARTVMEPVFKYFWRFQITGTEHLPKAGGAIFCPNHTSVLDSFFLPLALPRRITYVGKAEYLDDWKTKHLFPALGMIPIDRSGGSASERALAAAERILQAGEFFGIYPEGTRSRDGVLHRGHTGPARLALRTGAPIIPVGIRGSRTVMPPEAKTPRPFLPVEIHLGRPITVDRYLDRPDDRMVLRQIIDEVMFEIRELSGQEYVDSYATKRDDALVVAEPVHLPVAPSPVDLTAAQQRSSAEVLGRRAVSAG